MRLFNPLNNTQSSLFYFSTFTFVLRNIIAYIILYIIPYILPYRIKLILMNFQFVYGQSIRVSYTHGRDTKDYTRPFCFAQQQFLHPDISSNETTLEMTKIEISHRQTSFPRVSTPSFYSRHLFIEYFLKD